MPQPAFVLFGMDRGYMFAPFRCRGADPVERAQRSAFLGDPRAQCRPSAQHCFMRDFDRSGLDAVDRAPVADEQTLVDQMTHERQGCFRHRVQALDPAPRFAIRILEPDERWNEGGPCKLFQVDTIVRQCRVTLRPCKRRFCPMAA